MFFFSRVFASCNCDSLLLRVCVCMCVMSQDSPFVWISLSWLVSCLWFFNFFDICLCNSLLFFSFFLLLSLSAAELNFCETSAQMQSFLCRFFFSSSCFFFSFPFFVLKFQFQNGSVCYCHIAALHITIGIKYTSNNSGASVQLNSVVLLFLFCFAYVSCVYC